MKTPGKKPAQPETALYWPVQDLLAANGFVVRGEVCHCDITAVRGEELVVVELKRNLNVDLLVQATDRQKITDSVYVALPDEIVGKAGRKKWRATEHLLKRLELGLILVSQEKARIRFHPMKLARKKQTHKRRAVLRELDGRSGDYNVGGSTRCKIVTAYRESAIGIACCLERLGTLSPKKLRALGMGEKAQSILSKNFYGWFERVSPGLYALTDQGKAELQNYPQLVKSFARKLQEKLLEEGVE